MGKRKTGESIADHRARMMVRAANHDADLERIAAWKAERARPRTPEEIARTEEGVAIVAAMLHAAFSPKGLR